MSRIEGIRLRMIHRFDGDPPITPQSSRPESLFCELLRLRHELLEFWPALMFMLACRHCRQIKVQGAYSILSLGASIEFRVQGQRQR